MLFRYKIKREIWYLGDFGGVDMLKWMLAGSLLLMAGCENRKQDETAMQSHAAHGKPVVAFVPVIDRSHSDLTWNVSQELTKNIRDRLYQKNNLYLVSEDAVANVVKKLHESNDPFGTDLTWVKKAFPQTEFVVFSELVRHREVPLYTDTSPQDSPAELQMVMRLRVVDVRGAEPKVVLQEFVNDSQNIPRPFTKANFDQVPWGSEMFDISPLGIAHAQFSKEVSSRIDDYILLSESK